MSGRSLVRNDTCVMLTSSRLGTMKLKSNTRVRSATIASKIKTRPSVTRTHFTFASNLGPAPTSVPATTMHSTLLALSHPQTTILPNNHLHLPPISLQFLTRVATVAINFQTNLNLTGMPVLHISPTSTSLANAINRRSSFVLTTFANTSSIAMVAPVASGQTC